MRISVSNSRNLGAGKSRPDKVLVQIADYVTEYRVTRATSFRIARYCLMDALGCALEALHYPACTKLLGPVVPGTRVPHGARVPGTRFQLDPVRAAFNIGAMIRWVDFNDGFAGGGHPSDNLGGILATADYLSRARRAAGKRPLNMRDVLTAMIKAYEIQGLLGFDNQFFRLGFDHVKMISIASTAVVTKLLGGTRDEIINAVSNAWADGVTLRIYRSAPNVGSRKSWAGGDATSRAVELGMMALKGEMGYPAVLTTKRLGFYDALWRGKPFKFVRPFGSYMLEHIIFKFVAAGMLAQTAVECAFKLHPLVKHRLADIASIRITSQRACMNIMDKSGPMRNPADRDHCLQYVVAVALIYGRLTAADFEDRFAAGDPRIDALRARMKVVEDPRFTRDFHTLAKRSVANSVEVRFKDGSHTPKITIEYPAGHPHRRADGLPMVESKFANSLSRHYPPKRQRVIRELCRDQARLESTAVDEFIDAFVI
jgi:2-methylcitrate dehydratase